MMSGEESVLEWIKKNVPEPKHEGVFYPYAYVYEQSYGFKTSNMGNFVRKAIDGHESQLYFSDGIGIQLGVQSHGKRGIRIFNMR